MTVFIDANVFVRLLVHDDEGKFRACQHFFESIADGAIEASTSEAIVAEVMYVLTSPATYRLDHATAAARVRPLLELPGIQVDHKSAILNALALFVESRLDFEDCIVIAHSLRLRAEAIVSYDRGFDRASPVRRTEPELPADGQAAPS